MNVLRHPRCLLLTHSLPLAILLGLGWRQYSLIESLLEDSSLYYWDIYAAALLPQLLGGMVVALWLDGRGKRVTATVYVPLAVATLCYLVYAIWHLNELFRPRPPAWLMDGEPALYLFTFCMPVLVHAVLLTVAAAGRKVGWSAVGANAVGAALIPLLGYLVVTGVIPLRFFEFGRLGEYLSVIGLTTATVCFIYFLLRVVYLLYQARGANWERYRLLWIIPVALVFPLLGLAVNNNGLDSILPLGGGGADGVFGNFHHPAFYLLALTNGLFLCLPRYDRISYRVLLFLTGMAGLPFLLYFVIVFLPFLPLSLVATIAFGLGVLMLTPLVLLPLQLQQLVRDYRYLRLHYRKNLLRATSLLALLLLPLALIWSYRSDRLVLHAALDYVYAPAGATKTVDPLRVGAIISYVREQKSRSPDPIFSSRTPYLASLYDWIVLDNLTLSDRKLNELEAVFLGTPLADPPDRFGRPAAARLTGVTTHTEWSDTTGSYATWVQLRMEADSSLWNAEYRTEFSLPPGVFVDDYYLYVGQERKPGILAERRAAEWVYNQITRTRRDPGLLRYVTADRLRLNVFPFAAGEVRRTGFRVLHQGASSLTIDGHSVFLDTPGDRGVGKRFQSGGTYFVPAGVKGAGTQVQRKPQLHFIIAGNASNAPSASYVRHLVERLRKELPADSPAPVYTVAGTYGVAVADIDNLEAVLTEGQPGGFFAQRALEQIYAAALRDPQSTYPVCVLLGADPVFTDELSAYAAALPEGPYYYRVDRTGRLQPYALDRPAVPGGSPLPGLPRAPAVIAYPNANQPLAFLPDDGEASVMAAQSQTVGEAAVRKPPTWRSALELYGSSLANRRAGQSDHAAWLTEVTGSFRTGILMPTTAYMVVENAAQEEALRRKQRRVLSGNPTLDLDEATPMDEPGLPWLLLPLAGYLFYRRR